jgi:APA family basic amino acid/polyamine antiporter
MTSFNAGIMTTSRFLYAMSRDKTMPKYLSKIHMEYFTPYAAIITLCAVALVSAILLTLLGGFDSFTYAVAGAEIMMYVLAALSVIKLRSKMKTRERPFRIPLYPLTAIFTAVFFSILFVMVFADQKTEVTIGFVIFISIIAVMVLHTIFVIPWLRRK